MYITPLFGISMIVAIVMVVLGNLLAAWKIHKRTIDFAEKCSCGCCGSKEEKSSSPASKFDVAADMVKGTATLLNG